MFSTKFSEVLPTRAGHWAWRMCIEMGSCDCYALFPIKTLLLCVQFVSDICSGIIEIIIEIERDIWYALQRHTVLLFAQCAFIVRWRCGRKTTECRSLLSALPLDGISNIFSIISELKCNFVCSFAISNRISFFFLRRPLPPPCHIPISQSWNVFHVIRRRLSANVVRQTCATHSPSPLLFHIKSTTTIYTCANTPAIAHPMVGFMQPNAMCFLPGNTNYQVII